MRLAAATHQYERRRRYRRQILCRKKGCCSLAGTLIPMLGTVALQEKEMALGGSRGRLALLETLPAIHWAPLSGLKGNCSFPLASRADCLGFYSLVIAAVLRETKRLRTFSLAVLTTFWLVLELLIVEKQLFTGGKHEVRSTVHAFQNLVLEIH